MHVCALESGGLQILLDLLHVIHCSANTRLERLMHPEITQHLQRQTLICIHALLLHGIMAGSNALWDDLGLFEICG